MADKQKKKPSFFNLKRWNSQRGDEGYSSASTASLQVRSAPSYSKANTPPVMSRSISITEESKSRRLSASGIKELIQCSLCLEVLHNPKMLPCQHTFCLACLKVYIGDEPVTDCPVCRTRIQVHGSNYAESLPSNLYIDTLLEMFGIIKEPKPKNIETPPPITSANKFQSVDLFAAGVRCTHCKTICDNANVTFCDHCKLNFCNVCWSQHLDDMRTQIGSILKQLESAACRLDYKIQHYKDRCEHILEQINVATEEKINAIKEAKINLIREATEMQKCGDVSALALQTSLNEAKEVAKNTIAVKDDENKDTVTKFMNLHQNTLQILSEVSKWDTGNFVFDKENFRIESDTSTPLEAESDEPLPEGTKQNNPLESEETLVLHYRTRTFDPHYIWRKTSRPSGIGISPWNNHLYICGMDSHCVLVVERSHARIVTRLSCEEMLCPVHIAFMKSLGEIYITDKWKHCVHVFSKDGVFIRSIGQKGSRNGMFRSPEGIDTDNAQHHIYVVDTGNDRVQILTPEGKFVDQIGVASRRQAVDTASVWETNNFICTEFNAPTSVAVTTDRVVILDSGNRRVKIYNKQDKAKIFEFGSLGNRKGQFRQPEVLALDPMGFILIGDSGNCRVQVFKPNGQLVRVFGRLGTEPGKFGWISGIHVTKQLDIIVSDTKNHCVNFF